VIDKRHASAPELKGNKQHQILCSVKSEDRGQCSIANGTKVNELFAGHFQVPSVVRNNQKKREMFQR